MFGNERRDPTLIGAFDPKCDLRKVIEDAADSASHLCDTYYLGSPEVEFEVINGKFSPFYTNHFSLIDYTKSGNSLDSYDPMIIYNLVYFALFDRQKPSFRIR